MSPQPTDPGRPPHSVSLSRQIAASPERVWALLVDPAARLRWFGKDGFDNLDAGFVAQPGGAWHLDATGPRGRFRIEGTVRVAEPGRRLVHSWRTVDAEGGASAESEAEILLEPVPGGTRVTVHHRGIREDPGMFAEGWSQSLGRLADRLGPPPGAGRG